jgi:ADP-heptose:LPS heptosyltransferase
MIFPDESSPAPGHSRTSESHSLEPDRRSSPPSRSRKPWTHEDRTPKRIAIFRALHLGDLLCATPALRSLRRRFMDAEITLIGLPWAEELVQRLPALDRLEYFEGYPGIPEVAHDPGRASKLPAGAQGPRYDLAIQMHGDGKLSNGFIAGLGAKVTVGYRRIDDARLTLSIPYVADEPEVVRWLRLVGLLGAEVDDCRLEFPTTPEENRRARELLAGAPPRSGPLIGLHAGASTPLRRWPEEQWAQLAEALVERWDARIVLTGSDIEREMTGRIDHATQVPVLDLAGRTDLGTFAALIGQLDLLVTNDTGASHLAAAAGTPSVIIFATTQPYQWAPLDCDRHLVVDARTYDVPEASPVEALARLAVEPVLLACERHVEASTFTAARS